MLGDRTGDFFSIRAEEAQFVSAVALQGRFSCCFDTEAADAGVVRIIVGYIGN